MPHGLVLAHLRFLSSLDIFLAIDDQPVEVRRTLDPDLTLHIVMDVAECERFHRQLFYWLLWRRCPSPEAALSASLKRLN